MWSKRIPVLIAGAAVLLSGLVVALPGSEPARASATFTVTTLADDGTSGTLRDAITQANATAGADTIVFDPNLPAGSITLTSALPRITESLTITGPGQANLTIDGDGQYLIIDTDGPGGVVLNLSGLTIRNGRPGDGYNEPKGALVRNKRNTINATDVTFRDQRTGISILSEEGGSRLNFVRCTFANLDFGVHANYGNTPALPSGTSWLAHNDDTIFQNRTTITDSTFTGNRNAVDTQRFTIITNSVFENNTGTAAYIQGLNRSHISGNTFRNNNTAIGHMAWINPPTMNMGTDLRYINANTFVGNNVGISLGDRKDPGGAYQGWTTVTNNSWDGSGTWIVWRANDGTADRGYEERTVDRPETQYTASGNTVPATLNAPRSLSATAGDEQVALTWAEPTAHPSATAVESYTVSWSDDNWTTSDTASVTTTSHTVTGLAGATSYDFRVRAVNTTAGVQSSWTANVSATPTVAPTTTTTTTTTTVSTSTTTIPVSTSTTSTTAAPATTAAPVVVETMVPAQEVFVPQSQVAAPVTTVAPQVAAPAVTTTSAPAVVTSTTAAVQPVSAAVDEADEVEAQVEAEVVATSTTLPAVVAPEAPTAEPGSAVALVDGETVDAELSRSENRMVLTTGDITTTAYGESADGERIPLDDSGALRLDTGDVIVVEGAGFEPGSEVEVWMMSTPTLLGDLVADQSGAVSGRFALPVTMEPGEHRLVLSGAAAGEVPVVLAFGVFFGSEAGALWSGIPIWIPVSIAIGLALIVPTRYTRRRRAMTDGED